MLIFSSLNFGILHINMMKKTKFFWVTILTVLLAEREENFGNKEVGFGCIQEQTA